MTDQEKRDLITAYADAFNRGDIDAVCRLFAPDAVVFGVLGWGEMEEVRPIWEQLVTAFKMNLKIEAIAVDGENVVVRYTETGTFVAPFRGTAPTGKSYEIVAMEWFIVRGGQISWRWGARDSATISRQLGIPAS